MSPVKGPSGHESPAPGRQLYADTSPAWSPVPVIDHPAADLI